MNRRILLLCGLAIILFFISCENSRTKNKKTIIKDSVKVEIIKPTVNVYIENSGSMDGFVNKGNQFTKFVSTYLADISISFTDDINLFYINDRIIPLGKYTKDFNNKLNVTSFRKMGGNRGETNISQIVDTILKRTDDNSISILISDCIFSPGSNRDAQKYIQDQYNGIKISMAQFSKKYLDAAVIIYQLLSDFEGTFYNSLNIPFHNTREELPYYVWLIGNSKLLKDLINKLPNNKYINNKLQNVFSITNGNKSVDYAIKMGSGNFDLNKKYPKTTIDNLKRDTKGKTNSVRFSVDVNFDGLLLSDDYLNDLSNYEMNNKNYNLTINKAASNNIGYTHQLNFESSAVHKGDISVKLKTQIPKWIEEVNDSLGKYPVKGKTYGIKYMVNGIFEAFTISNNYYTEIRIKIN